MPCGKTTKGTVNKKKTTTKKPPAATQSATAKGAKKVPVKEGYQRKALVWQEVQVNIRHLAFRRNAGTVAGIDTAI